jgi:hypothetical protein
MLSEVFQIMTKGQILITIEMNLSGNCSTRQNMSLLKLYLKF